MLHPRIGEYFPAKLRSEKLDDDDDNNNNNNNSQPKLRSEKFDVDDYDDNNKFECDSVLSNSLQTGFAQVAQQNPN